ncbi:inter-alpha-trypsin inhibitor heavy chain H4 isoform X2 [Octodon degus]|uniref:Inter-alpha-trypsin inhibitor heavy chain H4 isoform X2 n=1 Tax=Octodon degus TaxID=10160 RepID=A0A6P6EHD2_OCTDE|nr:inter-alpha-trypsin inhibitor heavy chain H4 isoform X2 [Octodon degus]
MKVLNHVHTCSIFLVLPSLLLTVLQTATAHKNGIDIYSLTVDSKVSSRFAHTVVTSRVVNKADAVQEAVFQMELPRKAFITNFSMIIDGVTYPGTIKEKVAAHEQYTAAVSRGENAGLIKATGRKMEEFQVSVSVAPAAKITFELVYEELLRRHLGMYELLLRLQPQQLVKHLQMDIHIFEPQGIRFLETESTFMTNELAEALTTSQNETKAHIRFKPTLSQQQKSPEQEDTVLDGHFIVRYDVNRTASGGSVQIENGYFVHHFAPEGLPTMPKNVVFVIDKSGSMVGRKIQQTKEALIKILSDLSPRDQFNIIVFNSEATQWKESLVPASEENVSMAKSYAATIIAAGGTNINDATLAAVRLLDHSNRAELLSAGSISLIILLTDGDPTVGETNPKHIQKNVKEAINNQYSLFCLGFGFDVSYAFLEKMALDNGGLARRIYEDSDSALQLQDFYQEVANPLLRDVAFEYSSNAVEEVTRDNFRHHFKGSEMVVAGKLRDQSPDVLLARVRGQMDTQNITFQVESSTAEQKELFQTPKYIFHNFMERLWAYLTIQQLLENFVSASEVESEALKNRALNLSLNYNFVTPLTSMVVTKPEGQEQSSVANKPVEDDNRRRHFHIGVSGAAPVGAAQRHGQPGPPDLLQGRPGPLLPPSFPHQTSEIPTAMDQYAPSMRHFILSEPDPGLLHRVKINAKVLPTKAPAPASVQHPAVILLLPEPIADPVCVDMRQSQGPMDLLLDPDQGLEVSGQYNADKAGFCWIDVIFKNPQLQVHVLPERVVVVRNRRSSAYAWKETLYLVLPGMKVTMDEKGLLLFSGPDKVTISLSHNGPEKGLLLFLRDTDRFSSRVNGTLGQFYRDVVWEPAEAADDSRRVLRVQGKDYSATRELKFDYQKGKEISCWSVEL